MIPANTNSVKSTEFVANTIKAELSWVKVKASSGRVQKMAPKKVSGEAKTPAKKAPAKKAPAKKEEK
jgi:hypothetical protein